MQPSPESNMLLLAQAVADGARIDWDHAESSAADPDEQHAIQQLRKLAAIAGAARAQLAVWGPLELRGEIGSGTFGTVYRAWDSQLEREVALKLLREGTADSLGSALIQEGRVLAKISHPNVVTVFGADTFDDRVGLWMEFVSGRTLKEIVAAQGPFGAPEAIVIGRDLCRALAAVHQRGYLHRDVKAQNVMREAGGRTVLMDFGAGISAAFDPQTPVGLRGTPAYLAPELLAGQAPSVRSDLYSLGVLLFFLVTGEFPVTASSLEELEAAHRTGAQKRLRDVRPDLPDAFVRVVDAATAINPAERPESAGALEALIERAFGTREAPPQTPPRELQDARPSNKARQRWVTRVTLAAVVLIALLIGGWLAWGRRAPPPAPAIVRSSVAVRPFENLTPDAGNDYFVEGVAQDIVRDLSQIRELRVLAGSSLRRYRDRNKSATDIGKDLPVAAVLDGRVRHQDGRVVLTVALYDSTSGQSIWTETFDRDVEHVVAMQTEAARKIALVLRGELSRRDAEALESKHPRDFKTFDLYSRGAYAIALRTERGLNQGIEYYQQAIARDPSFALAYAGLAEAYSALGTYGFQPRRQMYTRAAEAANKAIALDPSSVEAHLALAFAHKNRFEWQLAEERFKHALQLKPDYARTHHWYSIYLMQQGRFAESIAEAKSAISLDPLSIGANLQLASALLMARRYEDAISQWQRALQLEPTVVNAHRGIASAYTFLGLYDRALAAAANAARHAPLGSEDQELKADLGYLLAVSGRRTDALRIVRQLEERFERAGEEVGGSIAAIYIGLGRTEMAFEWLAKARDRRDPEMGFLKIDPRWDPLRKDPRFGALLASFGFAR